jgi:hypothetical protein
MLDKVNLKITCSICGEEYLCNYIRFKSDNKIHCNKCSFIIRSSKKRKPIEDIKIIISNDGSGCELLEDEYKNTKTKMNFKCSCGEKFETSWENYYYRNVRCCKTCVAKNRIGKPRTFWTYEKLCDFVIEFGEGSKLLSKEYKDYDDLLFFECKCGEKFNVSLNNYICANCRQCSNCGHSRGSENQRGYSIKSIKEILKIKNKNLIVLSKKYINAKENIKLKCKECNEVFERTWDSLNNRNLINCPSCNCSKGEKTVREFLIDNNIQYGKEVCFNDLLSDYGNALRFDFIVYFNNNIKFAVEYDGEFHYEPITGYDNFEKLKYHDRLKNEYCIKNNIPLIRIPYWDFDNIEEILIDILINNNMNSQYIINNRVI